MLRELGRLSDYVVKQEFRENSQEKQILELKVCSLENNIIINGNEEQYPGKEERIKSGKNNVKSFWKGIENG